MVTSWHHSTKNRSFSAPESGKFQWNVAVKTSGCVVIMIYIYIYILIHVAYYISHYINLVSKSYHAQALIFPVMLLRDTSTCPHDNRSKWGHWRNHQIRHIYDWQVSFCCEPPLTTNTYLYIWQYTQHIWCRNDITYTFMLVQYLQYFIYHWI